MTTIEFNSCPPSVRDYILALESAATGAAQALANARNGLPMPADWSEQTELALRGALAGADNT